MRSRVSFRISERTLELYESVMTHNKEILLLSITPSAIDLLLSNSSKSQNKIFLTILRNFINCEIKLPIEKLFNELKI